MPGYYVKPGAIRFHSGKPSGAKLSSPLDLSGVGKILDATGNGYTGTIVGPAATLWGSGPFGPCLANFSTSNYVTIDPPTQILGVVYPCWMAAFFSWTPANAGNGFLISQGSSSSTNSQMSINVNAPSTGGARYNLISSAGVSVSISSTGLSLNDGNPHLLMAISYSASNHVLIADGAPIATGTSTLGSVTSNQLSIGVQRTTVAANSTKGQIHGFWLGNGVVPDPWAFYLDPWASLRERTGQRLIRAVPGFVGGGVTHGPWPFFLDNMLCGGFSPMGM